VLSHRLYGKAVRADIRAGETTYVEVATAGVGVSASRGGSATRGSRFGAHFVTLTPSYHSATQVPGLRYRVLFPTLVAIEAGPAQSALRRVSPCGTECNVSPKIAELATRSQRGSPAAESATASPLPIDRSAPEAEADSGKPVDSPAAPDRD